MAHQLVRIIDKVKVTFGILDESSIKNEDNMQIDTYKKQELHFEELLFLRIAFEYSKMNKKERSDEFFEILDKSMPTYSQYEEIFNKILHMKPINRLILSEWLKFSL